MFGGFSFLPFSSSLRGWLFFGIGHGSWRLRFNPTVEPAEFLWICIQSLDLWWYLGNNSYPLSPASKSSLKVFLELQEPGGRGLLFVWGGFLRQPCAREFFICAEWGEDNQRICNNPAATQEYSRGLHIGAQLWLYLGHSSFPIKTFNVPSILLAFLAGSSESSLRCNQKMELGRGMTCFEDIIKLLLTLPHLLQKLLFLWGKKCFLGLWIICSNDIGKI